MKKFITVSNVWGLYFLINFLLYELFDYAQGNLNNPKFFILNLIFDSLWCLFFSCIIKIEIKETLE